MTTSINIIERLQEKGVIIHAPGSVSFQDIRPENIEAGVEIFPGVTLRGSETLLLRGSKIGRCGGGFFENIQLGEDVDLYGGFFQDSVFLHGVKVRGHAEMRGGTLMEEQSETAQHVGFKMTIAMPFVIAGSLINFCDALIAGGTSRRDHSEIGSCLALYNFTPWGDKFASLFGDVPRGVFLRSPRIFIGGQTQIVSPVHIGYGATIPAGCAVRRDVPEGRIFGEAQRSFDGEFDTSRYGSLRPKLEASVAYIAQLHGLRQWYLGVRIPLARRSLERKLFAAGVTQIEAGVQERVKRIDQLVDRLPLSLESHRMCSLQTQEASMKLKHDQRISEHLHVIQEWPQVRKSLISPSISAPNLETLLTYFREQRVKNRSYLDFMLGAIPDILVQETQKYLQNYISSVINSAMPLSQR